MGQKSKSGKIFNTHLELKEFFFFADKKEKNSEHFRIYCERTSNINSISSHRYIDTFTISNIKLIISADSKVVCIDIYI